MRNVPGNSKFSNHYSYMFCSKSHTKPLPALGIIFFIVPALFYGCINADEDAWKSHKAMDGPVTKTEIPLSGLLIPDGGCLDILTFNDDKLRRLDSYIRIDDFNGKDIQLTSQSGKKIVFICANSHKDRYEWADINSYSSIRSLRVNLENESRESMAMTGECRITAGKVSPAVSLKPIASEILISSIGCDFSGLPYEKEKIHDVKAYLINVNAETYLGNDADGHGSPLRVINMGMFNPDETDRFKEPGIIMAKVADSIGSKKNTEIRFLCYPNYVEEESFGSPFTRLVIEGRIEGHTYYWPIDINRQGGNYGIRRNRRYVFDIMIKRKGTDNPDIPVRIEDIESTLHIMPWKEAQQEYMEF